MVDHNVVIYNMQADLTNALTAIAALQQQVLELQMANLP
jgi:hypothetical protein